MNILKEKKMKSLPPLTITISPLLLLLHDRHHQLQADYYGVCAGAHQLLFLATMRTVQEHQAVAERRGFLFPSSSFSSSSSSLSSSSQSSPPSSPATKDRTELKVWVPQCSLKRWKKIRFFTSNLFSHHFVPLHFPLFYFFLFYFILFYLIQFNSIQYLSIIQYFIPFQSLLFCFVFLYVILFNSSSLLLWLLLV